MRALVGWLAIVLAGPDLCAGQASGVGAPAGTGTGAAPEAGVRWISVKPTVFLVREREGLLHLAEATVESAEGLPEATIEARLGGRSTSTSAGTLRKGRTTLRVPVPEALAPAELEIVLRSGGAAAARHAMTWEPQRHWDVHFVPITHHDLGYTDTIENVLGEYRRFYDDVLRFCDETKDWPEESKYRYTCEGTWSIQDYVDVRPPAVVSRLFDHIRQGRIEVTALFGNEISGLCGHEELIRLMYPSFRLKRLAGGEILTAGITDIPGLSWGLPTVLRDAGVKYFFAGLADYFQWGRNDIHTFWDEAAVLRHGRPDAFRWQGPDGESVLVYYSGSYGFFGDVKGPNSYQEVLERLPGKLQEIEKSGNPMDVVRYIHNGVDNCPPDVKISHVVREWNERWAYPRLWVATNAMFFKELEKRCGTLRTFRGELPHTDYAVGATSTAKETSTNRRTHDVLGAAEKFATIAALAAGADYPAERIRTAYDCMMLYDEHTWGRSYPAGEVQDLAWHEKSQYSYRASGLAASILEESLEAIARRIDLGTEDTCLVVFNPLSFPRTDAVRFSRIGTNGSFDLVDEETREKVPWQLVKIESPLDPVPYAAQRHARGQFEPHELLDLVFVAENVPPLGHKTYRFTRKEGKAAGGGGVDVTENGLENRFFKVLLDPKTGAVKSIHDKELGREIVDGEAAHGLNEPVVRWVHSGKVETGGEARIRKGTAGPVCGSLRVERAAPGCPQVIQEIILYDALKRIDFVNRVLKDSTPLLEVYFAFPFKVEKPQFTFEASNSVIVPFRDQFPGSNSNYYSVQHWADVSDGEAGVALAPIDAHLLEFGGLWPCYVSQAHHGVTPPDFGRAFVRPEEVVKGHMYSFVMDTNFRTNFQPVQQADMLFRYSVTTHRGTWKEGQPRDFGWSASCPLRAVSVKGKETKGGVLPKAMSFCTVDAPNVLVLAVKKAEDGEGTIVRLIETEGRGATATLAFPNLKIAAASRTNVVEEGGQEIPSSAEGVKVDVKPFGIATVRVRGAWAPRRAR